MALELLRIEGFRSIYEAELRPRPLTVLVGPNNSGKSTFAEAIDFLSDVAQLGLEVAVARKGGFDNIAFRRQRRTRRGVAFTVETRFTEESYPALRRFRTDLTELTIRYSFSFKASSQSRIADFSIDTEHLVISGKRGQEDAGRLVEVVRTGSKVDITTKIPSDAKGITRLFEPLDDRGYAAFLVDRVSSTRLLLADLDSSFAVWWFVDQLGSAHIYRLAPAECRKPGSPTPNPHLSTSGENLPAVARYLRQEAGGWWAEIIQRMRGISPDLESIEPDFTSDRRLTLLFREKGFGRPWTSAEISDGTIQSLALFTALFDPRVPIALIEEPENSIHPWIIRTFVDAIRQVQDKQIFVTTHSPALIAYLSPPDVSVVWKHEGRTNISPLVQLDPKAQDLWEQGEFNLFDLTDGGYIRQTIPQGFV
jgi:predicted ATPase